MQKNIIIAFRHIHPDYRNYVDESVYSIIRLFRLPNQCKQRDNDVPDPNDVHKIITEGANEESMVIQNIDIDIPEITVDTLPAETIRQIGIVALENKRPVNPRGRSGKYAPREFIETITTQLSEINDTNLRLARRLEEAQKINEHLMSMFVKVMGTQITPSE